MSLFLLNSSFRLFPPFRSYISRNTCSINITLTPHPSQRFSKGKKFTIQMQHEHVIILDSEDSGPSSSTSPLVPPLLPSLPQLECSSPEELVPLRRTEPQAASATDKDDDDDDAAYLLAASRCMSPISLSKARAAVRVVVVGSRSSGVSSSNSSSSKSQKKPTEPSSTHIFPSIPPPSLPIRSSGGINFAAMIHRQSSPTRNREQSQGVVDESSLDSFSNPSVQHYPSSSSPTSAPIHFLMRAAASDRGGTDDTGAAAGGEGGG